MEEKNEENLSGEITEEEEDAFLLEEKGERKYKKKAYLSMKKIFKEYY